MKRSVWLLTAFCCATCVSCKAPRSAKTSFDRDPLVMAHLTHRKDDPMYAETEVDFGGGAAGIADDSPVRPASVSQTQAKKPPRGESMADSYA
ncbi:MAG TPA: hypothetical protein VNC50_15300, partial [Planctomycetia bacterium]|nr:hypothetical protein [Planctomycetia bacterium]